MKLACFLAIVAVAGCSSAPHPSIVDGSRGTAIDMGAIQWTDGEQAAEVAVIEVRRGNWSSEHIVRLAGAEKPHVHQRHDVVVTLLTGRVRMHLSDQIFEMQPGDIATIPHGAPHWAENLIKGGASTAYAVFTPPYDGQDNTLAN